MLGDILRAEREKRGLTIKDIEQETSIRSIYIDAIEKGEYNSLPGAVYARGFIRNYASLLELDGEELVQEFRQETEAAEISEQTAKEAELEKKAEAQKAASNKKGRSVFSSGDDFHERVEKSHRVQNMIVVAAVLLISVVGAVFYLFGDNGSMVQGGTVKKEAVAPAKAKEKTPESKQAEAQTQKTQPVNNDAPAAAGEINLVARFTKSCWTQVVADGKTIYEGTIQPGESFNWKGKEKVSVLAGNAGAVSIAYNGKDVGRFGNDGEVVEKLFTKGKVQDIK